MKYLIANWKSELTLTQIETYMQVFSNTKYDSSKISVIVCPPFPYMQTVKKSVSHLKNVFLGAQTVSPFNRGPYTGEVTAEMIKDFAEYVIVGHSERRNIKNETEADIENQLINSKKCNLKTILCIRNERDKISELADVIAYEPESAIGTGVHPKLIDILSMKSKLVDLGGRPFIYGGSVDKSSVSSYNVKEVDGFLVGKSSIYPEDFVSIIRSLE